MPKLYIANCSKQEFMLTYKLKDNTRDFVRKIRPGTQTELVHSLDECNQIVKQHQVYGMQEAGKLARGFSGICYRIDKPVNVDAIMQGFTEREHQEIERAAEVRRIGAAATDAVMVEQAKQVGATQLGPTEVQVIEEGKSPADPGSGFNETFQIRRDDIPEPKPIRRRRSA